MACALLYPQVGLKSTSTFPDSYVSRRSICSGTWFLFQTKHFFLLSVVVLFSILGGIATKMRNVPKKGVFPGFRFFHLWNVLKRPVFGDDFIFETRLGVTTFVPLGGLGHLREAYAHTGRGEAYAHEVNSHEANGHDIFSQGTNSHQVNTKGAGRPRIQQRRSLRPQSQQPRSLHPQIQQPRSLRRLRWQPRSLRPQS